MGGRYLPLLPPVLVLAVVLSVFSGVVDFGFTNWDDGVYVTTNPLVTRLDAGSLREIFTGFLSGNYHPLTLLTHAVEYRFAGLDPRVYHAVNLGLHLLNAALLYRLLLSLAGSLPAAVGGTLWFALHPMRAESVAWVADRKDLLQTLFCLAAILAYLSFRERGRIRAYLLCGFWFLLALLSKGTAVVLPGLLLLVDFLQGRRLGWRALREKIPLLVLSAVFAAIALQARASYEGVLQESPYGPGALVFLGAYRFVFTYLLGSLLPWVDRPDLYPEVGSPGVLLTPLFAAVVVALASLGGVLALSARRDRALVFGVGFFALGLLPSLSVVVVGFSADRFSYLPAVGLAFAIGAAFSKLARKGGGRGNLRTRVAWVLLGLLATSLAVETRAALAVWSDSVALWTHALERNPGSGPNRANRAYAYFNRAAAHRLAGDPRRALADLDEAVRLQPSSPLFLAGRGTLRAGQGDAQGALEDLGRALAADPGDLEAALTRAEVHRSLGSPREAWEDLSRALAAGSPTAAALNERGIISYELGNPRDALADFDRALGLEPASTAALVNRGLALLALGERARAMADFARALELDPSTAGAHYGMGAALLEMGEARRAGEELSAVLRLDPGYPGARLLRAQAYFASGDLLRGEADLAQLRREAVPPGSQAPGVPEAAGP